MQGIEILNKEPIMMQDDKFAIIGIALLVIAGIFSFIAMKTKNDVLGNGCITVMVLCLIISLGVAIAYNTEKIPSDKYQYEAIIDENVSIQEVYEKYNVIEQDGKKWILEDKEGAE